MICISQDSFYRDLNNEEKERARLGRFNFDHPEAFDEVLMYQTLKDILDGKKVSIPSYDYRSNEKNPDKPIVIYPADVVLFEGILVFYFPAIRDLFHMKLFVDTDSDTRLARRVPRDINGKPFFIALLGIKLFLIKLCIKSIFISLERGRNLDQVLQAYMLFVKPAFEEFCSPTKKFADVIIPRGADNTGECFYITIFKLLFSHFFKLGEICRN